MIMVILNKKQKAKIVFGLVTVCLLGLGFVITKNVKGISFACSKSEACREAAAKEEAANKNAAAAADSANAFQNKVNELNAQIANVELMIAETEAQVEDLNNQIKKTEEKLENEQEALVELLINMHFEGDAEPIAVLAGSTSISDLAEKQARNEVVKQQISATAVKIKEAKEKLEQDKAKVEDLLAQQKLQRQNLASARAEQQALVEKYQNDAEAYEEEAKQAAAARIAAEEEYQRNHPELFNVGSSYSGLNTYEWQWDCPAARQEGRQYYTVYNGRYIGGYVCECTSYAGWKAYEATNGELAISWWGNAKSWAASARAAGYTVDHNASAYSIGQSGNPGDAGTGHVFWVEGVNADGTVNITEYNNWWATGKLTGSYHAGDFGARTISASEARQYNYIHVR